MEKGKIMTIDRAKITKVGSIGVENGQPFVRDWNFDGTDRDVGGIDMGEMQVGGWTMTELFAIALHESLMPK